MEFIEPKIHDITRRSFISQDLDLDMTEEARPNGVARFVLDK